MTASSLPEIVRELIIRVGNLSARVASLERSERQSKEEVMALRRAMVDDADIPNIATQRRTIREIIAETAFLHDVTAEEICGLRKYQHISRPRQKAMFLCHEAGYSTPQIGRVMGGRDASTVLHGIKAHMAREGIGAPMSAPPSMYSASDDAGTNTDQP